jgi:hypothetical protein
MVNQPVNASVFPIDKRGQDVRHISMTSEWSRGQTAIHSSI